MTALALLAGSSAWAADTTRVYAINTDSELTSTQLEKENAANEAYTNLLESFRAAAPAAHTRYDGREDVNMTNEPSTAYTVDGIPANGFPDYYAGAYMNANHELVVMITDNAAASKSAVRSLSQSSEMNFRTAEHSYADLVRCMDEITRGWSSGSEDFTPIQYAYIDDFGNRVVVGVKELSDEYLELLRARLEYFDTMVFTECSDMDGAITTESTTVNCNTMIAPYAETSMPSGMTTFEVMSFGLKAKRGNATGFITAAHAISVGEYAFYQVNTSTFERIGECTVSVSKYVNGKVDAAFVEITNANYIPSGSFTGQNGSTRATSTTTQIVPQGGQVYMCGTMNQEEGGTVASTSYSQHTGATIFTSDLCLANYKSDPGDSGGLVYKLNGNTAFPVGIHNFSVPVSDVNAYGFYPSVPPYEYNDQNDTKAYKGYCKISNVLDALDVNIVR